MKAGDIYRWSYSEPPNGEQRWTYHCCSRIAIADERGGLRDTFWSYGNEGRYFVPTDFARLNLVFVANLDDLEKKPEYEADYFDDADIVNLNHPNSTRGNFYLRKGAVRSAKKMLEVARRKLEQSRSDAKSATRRANELCETIDRIESGDTDMYL